MPDLKLSTATTRLVFLTDSSDHVSGKTGLTLTITASKGAGAFASITPTVTERANGWYAIALTSSHTDTLGDLALHVTATGADPTDKLFNVVANILGDTLPANVTQVNGVAAGTSDGTAQAGASTTITLASGDTAGTNAYVDRPITITSGTGAGQSRVISAYNSTTKVATVHRAWDTTPDATSTYAIDPTSYATLSTTAPTGWIDANAIATDAITSAKLAADCIGASELATAAITKIQAGLSTYAGGDTAGTTTLLSRLGTPAGASIAADIATRLATSSYTAAPTAAVNAAAVWDLTTTGHTTSGTFGSAMNAAGSAGDPWSTTVPGAYGAGSAGYLLGTNLNATVSSRLATAGYTAPPDISGLATATNLAAVKTDTAAIKAKTDNLPASPAAVGSAMTVSDKTGFKLASDGVDLVVIETGVNMRQALSPILASAAGVLSGAATSTVTIKGGNVATTRVVAQCDSDGNRTSVTLALPS